MTRYKVVGKFKTLGHAPGDEFTADLDSGLESRRIKGGHLEIVKPKARPKASKTAEEGSPLPVDETKTEVNE